MTTEDRRHMNQPHVLGEDGLYFIKGEHVARFGSERRGSYSAMASVRGLVVSHGGKDVMVPWEFLMEEVDAAIEEDKL